MANQKKTDIVLLLRDYMNFLPSSTNGDFPLSAESLRRINKSSRTGETYDKLENALIKLSREHPGPYSALLRLYLREEAGHRDIDFVRRNAKRGSEDALRLLVLHEWAIDELADTLRYDELYVRYPHKATGPKPGQNMEEKHDELFAIFMRFYSDDGMPYRQSLGNAVLKMQNYYSRRHADRIIRGRLKELDNGE